MKHLTLLLIVALMVLPSCKKADVEPLGKALIVSFEASSTMTAVYLPVTLTWEVKHADMVILSDVGLVQAAGSREVNPQETTTYTLMAEGADGVKVSKSLTVQVDRTSACQGLVIVKYSSHGNILWVKVGPNPSAYYAARDVTIRAMQYDDRDRLIGAYYGVIPKIMPGEYGEVTFRYNSNAISTKVELIGCSCPLVEP